MSDAGRISSPSFLDDPRLRRLYAALDGAGEELRVVGGAIRNHLMQIPVTEVDLTTTASPEMRLEGMRTKSLVEDLMGRKPEKRYAFIQENARFARDLDV